MDYDYDSWKKNVCIASRYKTIFLFFLNSVVFIKLHTKILGMQPIGYGLEKFQNFYLFFLPFCEVSSQKMPRLELRPSLIVNCRPMTFLVIKMSRREVLFSL